MIELRRKSTSIKAVQYNTTADLKEMINLIREAKGDLMARYMVDDEGGILETAEGTFYVNPGDWLILENGELAMMTDDYRQVGFDIVEDSSERG